MIAQQDRCVICMEIISNPICKNCYLEEVDYWLKESNIEKNKRKKIVSQIKEKIFKNENRTDSTCIICKKNNIDICSYCFFYITFKILINENLSDKLIEKFLETFNYQLGYERYHEEEFYIF